MGNLPKLLFGLLLISGVAYAQETAPVRQYGGCNKPGTFCAGPSAVLSLTAYNLSSKTVEAGFSPGLGYGVTVFPKQWYATGADLFVSAQTGPVNGISLALVAKFANYIRVGIARQTIGGAKSWYVPFGIGVDL